MRQDDPAGWEKLSLAILGVVGSWGLQEISYLAAIFVSLLTSIWIGIQIILALREDRRKARLADMKISEFFKEQDK